MMLQSIITVFRLRLDWFIKKEQKCTRWAVRDVMKLDFKCLAPEWAQGMLSEPTKLRLVGIILQNLLWRSSSHLICSKSSRVFVARARDYAISQSCPRPGWRGFWELVHHGLRDITFWKGFQDCKLLVLFVCIITDYHKNLWDKSEAALQHVSCW